MKIYESKLRRIIRNVISESFEKKNFKFDKEKIKELKKELDFKNYFLEVPNEFSNDEEDIKIVNIKFGDIIKTSAYNYDKDFLMHNPEENEYLVLGFSEIETESKDAGGNRMISSPHKKNTSLDKEFVFLLTSNEEVYFIELEDFINLHHTQFIKK